MKKFIALFILMFVIASVCPAVAGPFSDVKPGHWAYEAIKDLSSKGILEGYPDGTFKGGKALTRYEAAQMVARLIEKGGVGDYETLQKLTIEFADELALLGVKVTALEDEMKVIRGDHEDMKAKLDHMGMGKIKVTAEARIRAENNGFDTLPTVAKAGDAESYLRFRLNMATNIDQNVSAFFSFQDAAEFGRGTQNNPNRVAPADNVARNIFLGYVDVKNFGGYLDNVRIGRQTFTLGKGFLIDGELDGMIAKKEYHGTVWQLAAFDNTAFAVANNSGFDTKLITVDHAWKRIAAGLYYAGIDQADVATGVAATNAPWARVGNLTVGGLTIDAKLGKDVVAYIEAAQIQNGDYKNTVTGGVVNADENGMGFKVGAEWTINKYYDLSVLYQNRKKDFFVMNHNDDYSDSAFYGNGPFAGSMCEAGLALGALDNYSNSNIMSVIFGAKLRDDLQLDLWYEALEGDENRTDLFGTTTNLSGNFDQTSAQAVMTYQYRDNTAFKLRYRAVGYDSGDADYKILVPAFRPADYNQLRLDMNVKF